MRASERRASRRRFLKGLLLYTLILLLLAGAGLTVFYLYIEAYEQSRPDYAMKMYMQSQDREAIRRSAATFLDGLDQNLRSTDDSFSMIYSIARKAEYAKKSSESTENRQVYVLQSDGLAFGRVTLVPGERGRFGFTPWRVAEESMDFSALCRETEITVPQGYAVVCNGYTLGEAYIASRETPYPLLEAFYEDFPDLPRQITYRMENYLGDLELTVLDQKGREVDPESLADVIGIDNCSAAEAAELNEFLAEYIERYVTFLSSANGAPGMNYANLLPYVVYGSELQDRLAQAIGGLSFAASHGDTVRSWTVNQMMAVGGRRYVCDVTYLVDTRGTVSLTTTTTNQARILIMETEYGLQAAAQVSY